MTEPIPGHPEDVRAAADALAGASGRFRDLRAGVLGRATTLGGAWTGAAGQVGLARIRHDADALDRAADACAAAAAPLRTFADELARAQQDWGDGSTMAAQGAAMAAGIGSGAPAEALRDQAAQALDDGVNVMDSAADRAQQANEVAAQAVDAASATLLDLVPPATTPQAGADGTFGDGLWKAGEDAVAGVAAMAGGTLDRINPFSDRFGPAWASTWQMLTTVEKDPVGAVRTVAEGTIGPILGSYRSGGVDEAAGRAVGVVGEMLADKGLGKLTKVGELGTVRKLEEAEVGPHSRLAPGGGLQWHENVGGHALRPDKAHVGATIAEIHQRLADNPGLPRVSSYFDRRTAERAVAENMEANKDKIDDWLNNTSKPKEELDFAHSFLVGRTATREMAPDGFDEIAESRVVLKRDPTVPEGYRILTTFPNPPGA